MYMLEKYSNQVTDIGSIFHIQPNETEPNPGTGSNTARLGEQLLPPQPSARESKNRPYVAAIA